MKNSIKLAISAAILITGTATVFAIMPSERDNQFIQLGHIEGEQLQLHKANIAIDEQIAALETTKLDNATQWQTMESERVALHDSLFQ